MAKHKKDTRVNEGNPEPIKDEVIIFETATSDTPLTVTDASAVKPLFMSDNGAIYRQLLLERPGVPVITSISEAVTFVGEYERWNNKVKIAFK